MMGFRPENAREKPSEPPPGHSGVSDLQETEVDYWWRIYTVRQASLDAALRAEPEFGMAEERTEDERNLGFVKRAVLFEAYLSGSIAEAASPMENGDASDK